MKSPSEGAPTLEAHSRVRADSNSAATLSGEVPPICDFVASVFCTESAANTSASISG